MLSKSWRPSHMVETEDESNAVRPPSDGFVSAHDAERLMVVYQLLSEAWADHFANATYYKEAAKYKREALYNIVFLKSEGKSDRQKDIDAKTNSDVMAADMVLAEATAALKLAELKHDGSVRAYHAMKKIVEISQEEKQYL